jgi:hypothetical protein
VISRSKLLTAATCLWLIALSAPAMGAAAPAWLPVGSTGPTVIPPMQSEQQKIFVEAEGGTFALSARPLQATGLGNPITSGESGQIQKAVTTSGTFAVGQLIEGPAIASGTTITSVTTNFGITTINLSRPTLAAQERLSYISSYGAATTTPALPYNAPASQVQNALEALAPIGAGNVQVTGGPGGSGPYVVDFLGSLANKDIGLLGMDSAALNGTAVAKTTVIGGPSIARLNLDALNIGGVSTSGTITVKATLSSGITMLTEPITGRATGAGEVIDQEWNCSTSTATEVICTRTAGLRPGLALPAINAIITAAPGIEAGTVQMEVSGGGAPTATAELPLTVSSIPAKPGIQSFTAGAFDEDGAFDTRAGGHPASGATAVFANTVLSPRGYVIPAGEFKDITVKLPPGFLGNPVAVPSCPESVPNESCPLDTMIGVVEPILNSFGATGIPTPVFNTEAPYGYPGKFRFRISSSVDVNVVGTLRSDEDYGLNAASLRTPQISQVFGVFFTFWGVPASPAHDSTRCRGIRQSTNCQSSSALGMPNTAFLSSATNCAEQAQNPPVVPLTTTLWQNPGEMFETSAGIPPVTGCDQLKFGTPEEPVTFTFEPSDTKSDSTASFRTSLTVPSEGLTNPDKLMTPEIKDTVVTLPEGVVLNASGADGLQACSLDQIGFKGSDFPMPNPIRFNADPQTCPEASKIGTGELKSALLEDPLHGALYLAAQGDGNPFGSLFAIYLVIEDPRHGIFIKLPGEVDPDPATGQMTVTFTNLPQLPFTRLDLNLKGGDRSALASPTTCGTFTTTATNTPWSAPESGPPTVSANSFEINQGPDGGPCAKTPQERPFDLGWSAGAEGNQAGASGPFNFRITRPDGSQELESLELKTPKGVSAALKGIPYCTEGQIAQAQQKTGTQERANSACPAASQIGTLTTAAGSGPTPFFTAGKAYLAGPYKGAPISVVAITPAVAGPFDLGNVVVRSAVYIDRTTAQVRAVTDQIPLFLKGVGLRIRDVRIHLDRKDWTINPTSCDASSVDLTAHGNSGAVATRSTRFQVGGCDKLAFAPKLKAHLTGGTKRGKHPAFTAELSYPEGPGYANIKAVQVTIPHSEFLDQAHIRTICTRPQAAAHQCPAGSIYGYAEAETPLIDGKLTGPVFLKSSDHQLPDLAIALRGPDNQPVEVEFQGRIDSIKGQIRNTIEGLPDVPVSKFVLRMKGGKKGLLVNSRDLCAGKTTKMTVDLTAQNNRTASSRPPLTRQCGGNSKRAKRHAKHARRGRPGPFSFVW